MKSQSSQNCKPFSFEKLKSFFHELDEASVYYKQISGQSSHIVVKNLEEIDFQ